LKWIVGAGVVGAAVVGLAGSVAAAPGECMVSGYGTFACDVTLDGGGFTFELPDGQTFAFYLDSEELGVAYIDGNSQAGDRDGTDYRFVRPRELGEFRPVANVPGCWLSKADEEFRFCVFVVQ
jgi:hypothetical protein